ncbi:MAG: hypothetical protein Q9222_007582 [Ikaeria aurantiellina]
MLSSLLATLAFFSVCLASPSNSSSLGQLNRAAYFQDNDPAGNFIVALKIDPYDGTLSDPVRTSTGGKGLAGLFAVSQDSVVVSNDPLGPIRTIPQTQNEDPTQPPAGPLVITADIVFNPSSTALLVTVRSNGKNPGLLYAFPVDKHTGAISQSSVVTPLPDFVFLFSMNFLSSDTRMLITNPHLGSPGAGVLKINYPSLKASVEKIITIPDQEASCWVAYSAQYSPVLYVIDAAQPNITVVDPRNDEVTGQFDIPSGTPGNGGADTKIDRKWLYVITDRPAAPKVEVYAVGRQGTSLRSVQSFDIFSNVGQIPGWMGLAIWPSTY